MHFFSLARQPSQFVPSQSLPILTRSVIPRLSKTSFATFMTPLRDLKSRSLPRSFSCSTLKLIPFWVIVTSSASSVVKIPVIGYSVLLRFDSNFLVNNLVNNRAAFSLCQNRRVFVRNHSYENKFWIQVHFHSNRTFFDEKGQFCIKTRIETEAQGKDGAYILVSRQNLFKLSPPVGSTLMASCLVRLSPDRAVSARALTGIV